MRMSPTATKPTSYSIGRLAREAGVPISTVRFYERRGILRPDGRTRANYRRYSADALEKLRLIRTAQNIGLSLKDVTEVLGLLNEAGCPCHEIEQVLRKRLCEVREKIRDLRKLEKALSHSLSLCCGGPEPTICDSIVKMKTDSACASGKIPSCCS